MGGGLLLDWINHCLQRIYIQKQKGFASPIVQPMDAATSHSSIETFSKESRPHVTVCTVGHMLIAEEIPNFCTEIRPASPSAFRNLTPALASNFKSDPSEDDQCPTRINILMDAPLTKPRY